MALPLAFVAATACAGPSAPVPSGFGGDGCAPGATFGGTAEMGVGDTQYRGRGVITDVDATVEVSNRIGGSCVGARYDVDDR